MQIFLDTADVKEIASRLDAGLVDGITTNPSLIVKAGADIFQAIDEICKMVDGPISAEVVATEAPAMIEEGKKLRAIADNVVVKLPLTDQGLIACRALSDEDIPTNVTLCFSVNQALLAAKAGATFVSPFVGRIEDMGGDGIGLLADFRQVYDNFGYDTQILAASLRTMTHVESAALSGCDAATLPPKIFDGLVKHPLTDKGLDAFLQDWASTGRKGLA